ncbi:MAG: alpha/beta hydrolase [Ktedonobacteraceae bacterium]|nr:alpha/beta hydrolase [Ktedonobacteraceae bacterium]
MSELTSTTGFLDVQAASLYYEVAGKGYPLLLLHAGVADSRMWDDQFPIFAQHYRTLPYDLRGFGQSRWESGPFASYEDPVALFNLLGVQKAHVIGISFGAIVALDFALAHPERVASLVLVAPSVGGTQPSEQIRRFSQEEDALVEKGDLPAATELNLRFWVDGPQRTATQVNPTVRQRVYEMQYHAFTVPMPEDADEQELQPSAITRLADVRVPTLIIVGDLDLPEKLELTAHLASSIPGARSEIITGAAHMVSMEQPQQFNRIVLNFLGKL